MNINNFPKSDNAVTLPEDLTTRPLTLDDLDAAVALLNRVSQKEYGRDRHTVSEIRAEWTSPQFNMEPDSLSIWNAEGDMVGYAEFRRIPAERMFIWSRVDPAYDPDTLGRYLLNWGEQQALADLHKTPAGVRVVLHASNKSDMPEIDALYKTVGYQIVRHMYLMRIDMTEEPAPVTLPDGVSLRPYRHPDDLHLLVETDRESFRDHWGWVDVPVEEVTKEFEHWFAEDKLLDPALTTFAVDDATGEIAGAVLNRLEEYGDPDVGYVEMLGVLRPYRKRGLGKALLRWAFRELYQRGKTSVTLHVDAGSLTGALRLYEKAGMRVVESSTRYEKVLRAGVSRMTTTVDDNEHKETENRNGSHK